MMRTVTNGWVEVNKNIEYKIGFSPLDHNGVNLKWILI